MATADGAPTFRLRIGTWPSTRYRCSFGSGSRGGLAAQRCVPPRGALGGRHERARWAAGRGYGGRRAAHRRPPLAGAPGFGCCIGRGHGRARPRRRGARQLRGAGSGQGQPPCAQQPGGAMIRHRKCAATDARNAGSLCPSSVLLGVSLARRLTVRNLLFRVAARSPGAGRCLCYERRQPGGVRLPRKLFLNPAPLGCRHHHLHLSRLSTLALAVSLRVGAGDIRRLCC